MNPVAGSFAFIAALTVLAHAPQDWPQFLGPTRNGVAGASIPASAKLVEAWRKPLGAGMSSTSVSDGRVFTLFTDETDDFLIALDARTGAELWKARLGQTHNDTMTNGPGSTPAIAAGLVIALGSSCRLAAYAPADGKLAWEVDVGGTYKSRFANRGGCSISPLVHGSIVVLPTGAPEGDRLVAFDAASGRQLWSAKGAERSINTNPSYRATTSGAQVLYHYMKPPGKSGVAGIELKDGSTSWSIDAESGISNTAPVPIDGDRVLLQMWSGSALFDVSAGTPRQVWRNDELTALPVPAVYSKGHMYGFGGNSSEFFKCVDAATGAAKWSVRIYRGAAALAGSTLVIQSEASGLLRLVAADPDRYEERAKLPVLRPGAATVTPPTIGGGMIFVRNLEEIVALSVR